ncbi:MAG: hypothetical protein COW70_10890 [Hydrogenophilales bacterium CG18_big_fil_WC_8_21_14_2_50_58_12]|nr:MAG: hypothetical protein COW70_10890 [Hydrogenophilales bacterium CG18_big_fil_WC_8_21_14_2_50_58_12]
MSKPMRISVRLHEIEDPALYQELEVLSPIARGHRVRALLRAGKNADGGYGVPHAVAPTTPVRSTAKPANTEQGVAAPAPSRGAPIAMDFSMFPSATMEAGNVESN